MISNTPNTFHGWRLRVCEWKKCHALAPLLVSPRHSAALERTVGKPYSVNTKSTMYDFAALFSSCCLDFNVVYYYIARWWLSVFVVVLSTAVDYHVHIYSLVYMYRSHSMFRALTNHLRLFRIYVDEYVTS